MGGETKRKFDIHLLFKSTRELHRPLRSSGWGAYTLPVRYARAEPGRTCYPTLLTSIAGTISIVCLFLAPAVLFSARSPEHQGVTLLMSGLQINILNLLSSATFLESEKFTGLYLSISLIFLKRNCCLTACITNHFRLLKLRPDTSNVTPWWSIKMELAVELIS